RAGGARCAAGGHDPSRTFRFGRRAAILVGGRGRSLSAEAAMNAERLVEALDGGGRTVEYAGLRFTNLDRVMWPQSGYTKRDMVRYYAQVARVMVPYLADRGLMLKRY